MNLNDLKKITEYSFLQIQNYRRSSIVQIGCGGTGSYLVPMISRILGSVPNRNRDLAYTLIDGDIVEQKNTGRQNFIMSDIATNKSQVLSRRYSSAFDVDIDCIPEYLVDNNKNMKSILQNAFIIISCVDNHKTRKMISDMINIPKDDKDIQKYGYNDPFIWIDAGNEKDWGHVFVTGIYGSRTSNYKLSSILNKHGEISNGEDKHPNELSCAERARSGEQSIGINMQAALTIFNICDIIIKNQSLNYYEVLFSNTKNTSSIKYLSEYNNITKSGQNKKETKKKVVKAKPIPATNYIEMNTMTVNTSNDPF